MATNLEQVAGKLHPLGFTPLTSAAAGQVLKYDFKGIGPRVMDKSGHGNGGWLKPPADPPRRRILSPFPLEVMLVFDGEGDYVKGPVLDIRNQVGVRARVKNHADRGLGLVRRPARSLYPSYGQRWQSICRDTSERELELLGIAHDEADERRGMARGRDVLRRGGTQDSRGWRDQKHYVADR